jgi:hypothetical protein
MPTLTRPADTQAQGKPVVDTLFLLIALSVLTLVTTRYSLVMDPDIWWHLRTGRWILANKTVPTSDIFSWHTSGQSWIAYTWLFDVLVSRIFDSWGLRGMLVLITAAGFAYTAWLTVFLARFTNLRRAMILSFSAYLAMMPLKSPRPWLFTILFFTAELTLLWVARERNRPVWLLPIVPLFVLWANMHIQFVYGLGLIGLFALESLLPAAIRRKLSIEPPPPLPGGRVWLLLLASTLATLLNPYGWNLYRVVWQYATQTAPLALVEEMQAMPFRSISNWIVLLLICLAIYVLGGLRRRNVLLISLLAVSCYFGFRSQRDTWFPVTVAVLALASGFRTSAPSFTRSRCIYPIAVPVSLAITLLLLVQDSRLSAKALRKEVELHFPEKASAYIASHRLPGPLFNSYTWGGYLIWRLPDMPVSIDGRANLYEESLAMSTNTLRGGESWSRDPQLQKARTILLEKDGALTSILRVDPAFHLVYEDETAVVFQPVSPRGQQ